MLAAPPGLSQPATSFIGTWRLGIHRTPLVAYACVHAGLLLRIHIHLVRCVSHEGKQVGHPGLEPGTSPLSGECSNQLS